MTEAETGVTQPLAQKCHKSPAAARHWRGMGGLFRYSGGSTV